MTPLVMACIAGGILLTALGGLAYALTAKPKHRDPHDGMARGCLMIAALPILALLAALTVSYMMGWTRILTALFYLCVIPAGLVAVQLVASIIMERNKKRTRGD
jgi:hypothetical protein